MKQNNKPWIKEERKHKAVKHNEYVGKIFNKEIQESINNSYVYYDKDINNKPSTNIIVDDITTDAAVQKYGKDKKYCVLNFASYKWPGGGFIIGATAQEESLCHASNLYNVIGSDNFSSYYENNRNSNHDSLYENFVIFSPDIIFTDSNYNNVVKADVITCPAPNLSAFHGSIQTSYITMDKRIKFLLDVAKKHNVKNLILGAFGCGVFKNDPYYTAMLFQKYLESNEYEFETVVFAIPAGVNYDAFKKIFK